MGQDKEGHVGAGASSSGTEPGPGQLSFGNVDSTTDPREQSAGSQDAFSTQLEMTQQQQRTSPFDLNGVANALPQQPPHRGSAPYGYGYGHGPQRHNGPAMMGPAVTVPGSAAQFPAAGSMAPVPGPHFYLPSQQHHMPPLYQPSLSPQPPSAIAPDVGVGYYGSPIIINQTPHPGTQYYYPPPSPFSMPNHFAGQYGMANFHHQQMHGMRPPQPAQSNQEAYPALPAGGAHGQHDTPSGRFSTPRRSDEHSVGTSGSGACQNMVRGPPRKPRQSGESCVCSPCMTSKIGSTNKKPFPLFR
jgi:hypothetical protein